MYISLNICILIHMITRILATLCTLLDGPLHEGPSKNQRASVTRELLMVGVEYYSFGYLDRLKDFMYKLAVRTVLVEL